MTQRVGPSPGGLHVTALMGAPDDTPNGTGTDRLTYRGSMPQKESSMPTLRPKRDLARLDAFVLQETTPLFSDRHVLVRRLERDPRSRALRSPPARDGDRPFPGTGVRRQSHRMKGSTMPESGL